MSAWNIKAMNGYRINSPYAAVAPGCPGGRHPHRWCKCKVFKTLQAARAYINEQLGSEE